MPSYIRQFSPAKIIDSALILDEPVMYRRFHPTYRSIVFHPTRSPPFFLSTHPNPFSSAPCSPVPLPCSDAEIEGFGFSLELPTPAPTSEALGGGSEGADNSWWVAAAGGGGVGLAIILVAALLFTKFRKKEKGSGMDSKVSDAASPFAETKAEAA